MDRREKVAIAIVALATLLAGAFALIPPHGVFRDPISDTKKWAMVAIALVAIAAPIALAEGVSDRHFRRVMERVRASRAWEREAAYDGPEGRGLLFEAPGHRALVLHAVGGVGAPRVIETEWAVEVPVVEDAPAEEGARAADEAI